MPHRSSVLLLCPTLCAVNHTHHVVCTLPQLPFEQVPFRATGTAPLNRTVQTRSMPHPLCRHTSVGACHCTPEQAWRPGRSPKNLTTGTAAPHDAITAVQCSAFPATTGGSWLLKGHTLSWGNTPYTHSVLFHARLTMAPTTSEGYGHAAYKY